MFHHIAGFSIDLLKVNYIRVTQVDEETAGLLNTLEKVSGVGGSNVPIFPYYELQVVFSGCKEPSIVESFPVTDIEKARLDNLIKDFAECCNVGVPDDGSF